jgi:hypothetical protein
MAGTAERIEKIGTTGSVTARLVENVNDLIDDVELVRAATRSVVSYDIEDLAAGADIAARAIYVAPRASTIIDSVRVIHEAASAAVDGSNTLVVTLRNITEGVDIASVTKTATTSANVADTLTLTAANADIASGDVLGIVVTQGASADAAKMILQFEVQPQTVDAAGDMTASKISDMGGTAY